MNNYKFTQGGLKFRAHWSDKEMFEVYPNRNGEKPSIKGAQWAQIAEVSGENKSQARANARLFAASPDMVEMIDFCAKKFREYEQLHLAKPDQEKASRNREYAERCEKVLRKVRGGK